MPKRKQLDYHKTKLTPGRTLPGGRNVTNTTFKAKKIVVQSQRHKEKAELTIKDYITKVNAGSVHVRASNLNHLKAAIINEGNNLSLYLSEILGTVSKNILVNEPTLVSNAINVLKTVFVFTDDLQISSFVPLLTNIISCTMTNSDMKIKDFSLKLLHTLLTKYPNLFCHSMTILNDLKGLLCTPASPKKSKKTAKCSPKTSLTAAFGDLSYTRKWRMDVLTKMSLFLQLMLNSFKNVNEDDQDQQEVYWDCKSPLYLEIFAGGGLKPVDIERLDAWNFNARSKDIEDPVKVQIFLSDLVNLLTIIFVEELSDKNLVTDDTLLSSETIGNLCILFQVLSHAAEWVKLLSNCDNDLKMCFTKDLNEKIFKRIKKFPIAVQKYISKSRGVEKQSTSLNLSVCYLYSEFLISTDSDVDSIKPQIFQYLKSLSDESISCEVRYNSIPVFIKIVKIYLNLMNASKGKSEAIKVEFVSELISILSENFNDKNNDHANEKLLFSFFVYLSLKPEDFFKNEFLKKAVKNWFPYLFTCLKEMHKSKKVDKKILKDIRKIASRRHPSFVNELRNWEIRITDLLQSKNEDISETAVFLIYSIPKISIQVFERCHGIILNKPSFSTRSFHMLISLLTHRFTEPGVPSEDRVNFIAFLVNTAIDSSSIYNDEWADFDLPEFSEAYLPCKNVTTFNILPSLHWKEHEKIYEVCSKALNQLPLKTVNLVLMAVYKDIVENKAGAKDLPIHSAIAMLRLMNLDEKNALYSCQKRDLTHSCLLFLSVFTTVVGFNEWYQWNVGELMKCLDFNRNVLENVIEKLEYDSQSIKKGIVGFYLLRIVKFIITKDFLAIPEDAEKLLHILSSLKESCKNENLGKQPLYMRLVDYISNCYF